MSNNSQSVIEFTYGRNADLYEDVLKISREAKPNDIKAAFFDRRAELYEEVSSKNKNEMSPSERQFCEKKMDAIVLAFRILHNRETRRRYDNMSRKNRQKLNYSESYSDRGFSRFQKESDQLNKSFPVPVHTTRNLYPAVVTPEKDLTDRKSLDIQFQNHDAQSDDDHDHDDDDGTVSTLGMRGAEGISPVKQKPQSKNIVSASPTDISNTSSVRIERTRLKNQPSLDTSKNSKSNSTRDDQSVHSTQSDANNSVNSDVLISRQRLNAKSLSVFSEDTDEEDEDATSFVSQDSSSETTQATSNTLGDDENDSDLVSFNIDEPTQEEITTPTRSQVRKRNSKHVVVDESNTDGGCFKLSKKELQDLDKDMVEGKSCFELMQGENGLPNPTRMFHLLSDEISGSLIDTVNALDQVFTAFNLSDENIDRVGDNIGDVADTLCLDDSKK